MLRWVSVDELLARLDEIQLRFKEEAERLPNKKNLGAEENTMRNFLGQPRNPSHATNQLTTEAAVVTEYDTTYDDENYNNFFGFNESTENCNYWINSSPHMEPNTLKRVETALENTEGLVKCKDQRYDFQESVQCNGLYPNQQANYAYISGTDVVQNSTAFDGLRAGSAAGCIDAGW